MIFTETKIPSALIVDIEKRVDPRGFFGRVWCLDAFASRGLSTPFVQSNVSASSRLGTLRGLHYQLAPYQEAKLVRCTRGAVFDICIDLRPDSPMYLQWVGVELSEATHRMFYIPEGCAHGYLTLTDDAEVTYLVTHRYVPEAERGIRYDDPTFAIRWPLAPTVVSDKDRNWPDYTAAAIAVASAAAG